MGVRDGHLLVADVADLLCVTPQRVRALLSSGELDGERVGGVWFVDANSLADFRHARQRAPGRVLAPSTAWAALLTAFDTNAEAEHVRAFAIVGERRRRLRSLALRDVDDWRWLGRRRASVRRYAARDAYLGRLRREEGVRLARIGVSDGIGLISPQDAVDAYVDEMTATRLVDRYQLRPDNAGNVTLRTINVTLPEQLSLIRQRPLPDLVVAVDLVENRDPRVHAAGRDLLTSAIDLAQSNLS